MVRSILAVVVGYLAMFAAITTFFAVTMFVGFGGLPQDPASFTPPAWLYVVELLFSPVAAVAGGYVCAWIARRAPMKHAFALAGVGVVLGIVSIIAESGMKPLWSSVGIVVLMLAGVIGGAKIRLAQSAAA